MARPTSEARAQQAYRLRLDIWDRASRAQVDLERMGTEEPTPEQIWEAMGCSEEPTRYFRSTLADKEYLKLVDLRRSLLVIPDVKNLGALRELASKGAQMATASALEDLILRPDKVSTRDKVGLTKTLVDLYKGLDKDQSDAGKMTQSELDEEQAMEAALARIPEAMRPAMRQVFLEEREKELKKQHTLHLVELHKNLGHAKDDDVARTG